MRLFYRKITVEGKENIPQKGPVIFAPNHQNALMDPLAVLYASRRQTIFLARADIFKVPLLRNLFYWLKIIPVYRIRDGKENLGNNEASFNVAVEVLENNRSVGIFPEAAHTNLRSILPLRKGVPRLAFLAEENNDFNLGINVVPAGIYFDDYEHMRSVLHVRFGRPILVKQFEEDYKQKPQKAMLLLRDAMAEELSELALDIRAKEYYDAFYIATEMYAEPLIKARQKTRVRQVQRFAMQKEMVAALESKLAHEPEYMLGFREKVLGFLKLVKTKSLKWEFLKLPMPGLLRVLFDLLLLLLSFPVFLYGLINNILFYGSVKLLVKKIKDHQFHSSIKFVWGLAISPLFYLLQTILVYFLTGNLFWSMAYFVLLPITGFAARIWVGKFRKTWQHCKLFYIKWSNRSVFKEIEGNWQAVFYELQQMLNQKG
jgi:1-acyl-sn-glycerol-3-phosphate acyltransferase